MDEFDRLIGDAKEVLSFAFDELKVAKKKQDELRARQACEKGYLALIKAFNAFL